MLLTAVALAGCSDDAVCGPGDAPDEGITVAGEGTTLTFGEFEIAPGGDCPVPGAPSSVVSVTMFGRQVSPVGAAVLTFCLPRPDLIGNSGEHPLDPDNQPAEANDRVHVIDVQGAVDADCRWTMPPDTDPDGTAGFEGFCGDGLDAAGFAFTLDGAVTVTETCTGQPDRELEVQLSGRVLVTAP